MPQGPLRLPLELEVHSLDPAEANDTVSRRITGQIFDTCTGWDPLADPPRLVPEILAALPAPAGDDELTWTLQLRTGPDARTFAADACLGGQARPVRASDVVASLRRLDPQRHSSAALIAGRFAGMTADDRRGTVTLRLTRPQPELPALLASPVLAIVPPECVAFYDGRDAEHPKFARHPVGSGRYTLDQAASELPRTAVLAPRTDLSPRPGRCPPVAIALSHFNDPEPALRSFQAGELAALTPGQSQFAEVMPGGAPIAGALPAGVHVQKFAALSTDLLVFRMTDPEIGRHADPRIDAEHRALRRAVALAFDGARWHRVIRNSAWATPRSRVVPRGIGADDGAMLHRFAPPTADLQQARQVLAAAGVPAAPRTLRYWTGTSEGQQQEAAILRDALRPLGITLAVTHRANYHLDVWTGRSDAQLYSLRFDADYLDPGNFLAPFVCGAADNYSGYCDAAYDAAFAAFAALPAGPGRDRAATELERMLGEDVPVRPIDQPEAWYLAQPWLHGLVRHPLLGLRLELLCPDR
jgi:ABC-type transport system substrate-binding protein